MFFAFHLSNVKKQNGQNKTWYHKRQYISNDKSLVLTNGKIRNRFRLWYFFAYLYSFPSYSEKLNTSHKHKRIIWKPTFRSQFFVFEFLLDKTSWREPLNKDITDKCKIHGPAECNQLPTCAAGYITHKIAVKILSY